MSNITPMGLPYESVQIRESTSDDSWWDGHPRMVAIFRDEQNAPVEMLISEVLDVEEPMRENNLANFYLMLKTEPPAGALKGSHSLVDGISLKELAERLARGA